MEASEKKPKRGRPKTFDRSHVITVAMQAYWTDGQSEVSLNAICQLANVSKPSLYKEFGSEDGLKKAVLIDYHEMTLAPLLEMLGQDRPFEVALSAFMDDILRDHQAFGMPNGCLFVDMCQCRDQLGPLAGAQVDAFRALSLRSYEAWIEKARETGAFRVAMSPRLAALYIDAQIASIMNMQRQGVAQSDISSVFRHALSVLQ